VYVLERRPDSLGIYIHFPYCLQKCHYCDFYSNPVDGEPPIAAFLRGIEEEWQARYPDFQHLSTVDSIFFGGGTSSLIPADALKQMLDLFQTQFSISEDCEITLEGNPENLTSSYLSELEQIGITRINAGIQTFSARHLLAMNRFFDPARYADILDTIRRSGIRSRGIDLIYGFPDQTMEEFLSDLQLAATSGLEHMSIYALTVEAGTAYAAHIRNGSMTPPDEALQERIFEILPQVMSNYGYTIYEISNYAKPGFECRHNLRYWLYEPYMGLGPGAHGFTGRYRYGNVRNVDRWLAQPASAPKTEHRVDIDLPLNLFRLTVPFRLSWMKQILRENHSQRVDDVLTFFHEEAECGHGFFVDDDLFQWNEKGRLQLDSIIERWVMGQKAK
jgi:oxygen-independent coproporphyrinogen-3 oxidase